MKLEVGKTYKTRGGEKVKVVYKAPHTGDFAPFLIESATSIYWTTETGRLCNSAEYPSDLIAEDIPTRT